MSVRTQLFCTLILISAPPSSSDDVLYDFDERGDSREWKTIDDGVTGGVADGRFEITGEGTLRFHGMVSIDSNGGFASVRSVPQERDLSKYDGISIRIKGDGKKYDLNIYADSEGTAGSYRRSFDTARDTWLQVFLPFGSLEAVANGQVLRDAPGLHAGKIRSLELSISEKQAGPFQIHVDWIKAARKPSTLQERLITAGCATCIFKMKEVAGCKLAVEIDGKHYTVKGTGIDDHGDAHAGDGLCNAARRAVVSGAVKEGVFVSSSLKLLPK